jgi:hypothetical protein
VVSRTFLEFPDGVRLAQLEEIPGPEADRSAAWARVKQAYIVPGFTVTDSLSDQRFGHYAEINVNASQIWALFCDLCAGLLSDPASLIASDADTEPCHILEGEVAKILNALEIYRYQLAHDGFLQFGLLNDRVEEVTEVLVTPTKHFKVWLNDAERFRSIMDKREIPERTNMEFMDEYPRVTTPLPEGRGVVVAHETLWKVVADLVNSPKPMH